MDKRMTRDPTCAYYRSVRSAGGHSGSDKPANTEPIRKSRGHLGLTRFDGPVVTRLDGQRFV
jgi:hypothetical protein